jgi:hypothetical protein
LRHGKTGPVAEVGVIGPKASAQHAGGTLTVAEVAEIHEIGAGVPRRSWLVDWFEENRKEIERVMRALSRKALLGTITPKIATAQLGVWAVGEIQQRIANRIPPPLAESTIKRKGSSVPLIDKGQLRQSITSRVVKG